MIKIKSPEKYTSRDIMNYWYQKYEECHGEQYSHETFGGKELKYFKELLEDYDIYSVLLALENGLKNGETSIRFICGDIEKYLPDTHFPKYHYLIRKYAGAKLKDKLFDLTVLETKSLQSADIVLEIKAIINEFDEWLISRGME